MDSRAFRDCVGQFGTGVVIVTAAAAQGPLGFTAQSFVSVSLDPPLIAICPARTSRSWPLMRAAGHFAVNILAADQQPVCDRFARSGVDKFADVPWRPGRHGAPVLADTVAAIEWELHAEHDAGDHTLVLGLVTDLTIDRPDAAPLIFLRGRYASVV